LGIIDSNHHPLIVWLKERGNRKSGRERRKKERKGVWDERRKEKYRQKLREMELAGGRIQEEMGEVEERIRKVIERIERERRKEGKREKGW